MSGEAAGARLWLHVIEHSSKEGIGQTKLLGVFAFACLPQPGHRFYLYKSAQWGRTYLVTSIEHRLEIDAPDRPKVLVFVRQMQSVPS